MLPVFLRILLIVPATGADNSSVALSVSIITTACENCHSQLTDLNAHYGLGMKVEFLSKLVADALVK